MNALDTGEIDTLDNGEMDMLDTSKMNILSLLLVLPLNPAYVTGYSWLKECS